MRVLWLAILASTLMGMPKTVLSFEEINTSFFGNLALHGYDAVSYFVDQQAVEGLKTFSAEWNNAVWWFSNAQNKERFLATPETFAPQYGGHCSNQMSLGNLSDIDPNVWMIVDNKLYLFGHDNGRIRWQTETREKINSADTHWRNKLSEE
jgi:hypothetical protein